MPIHVHVPCNDLYSECTCILVKCGRHHLEHSSFCACTCTVWDHSNGHNNVQCTLINAHHIPHHTIHTHTTHTHHTHHTHTHRSLVCSTSSHLPRAWRTSKTCESLLPIQLTSHLLKSYLSTHLLTPSLLHTHTLHHHLLTPSLTLQVIVLGVVHIEHKSANAHTHHTHTPHTHTTHTHHTHTPHTHTHTLTPLHSKVFYSNS